MVPWDRKPLSTESGRHYTVRENSGTSSYICLTHFTYFFKIILVANLFILGSLELFKTCPNSQKFLIVLQILIWIQSRNVEFGDVSVQSRWTRWLKCDWKKSRHSSQRPKHDCFVLRLFQDEGKVFFSIGESKGKKVKTSNGSWKHLNCK